jgi:hypothetical protein
MEVRPHAARRLRYREGTAGNSQEFSGYSITSSRPLKFTIAVPQPTP